MYLVPQHTILKVKLLSKNSILTEPQHFHEFFDQFFFTIFLVKSKLSTAKKSKTTTFSRVFHPKKIDNFLGKSKLNFWSKNEDFEQCERRRRIKDKMDNLDYEFVTSIKYSFAPRTSLNTKA